MGRSRDMSVRVSAEFDLWSVVQYTVVTFCKKTGDRPLPKKIDALFGLGNLHGCSWCRLRFTIAKAAKAADVTIRSLSLLELLSSACENCNYRA
jgi:hypothetical protein